MSGVPRWLGVCALVAQVGCASWTFGAASTTTPKPAPTPVAEAKPAPAPITIPPHPVIEAYIAGLTTILSEQEKTTLRSISLDGTYVGDAQRLRYLAADRAVRIFLPEALEATRNPELIEHARKIRALPPLMNPDTDAVAYDVVSEALRARERIEDEKAGLRPKANPSDAAADATLPGGVELTSVASSDSTVPPPIESSAVSAIHDVDADARAQYAEAVAAYSEAYAAVFGVSKLHADSAATAAADASDAAEMLTEAIARGADREMMVQVGISLVQQMADAARRRERVPLPKIVPPKPPSEPGAPP